MKTRGVVMTDVQGACDVKLENEDALKEERELKSVEAIETVRKPIVSMESEFEEVDLFALTRQFEGVVVSSSLSNSRLR